MEGLANIFKGGIPNLGAPGGTPPIVGGSSGGGTSSDDSNWITKLLPMLQLGMAGAGTIGNIQANRARNQVLSAEMAQMNALNKLTPDQIVKGIAQLQQPLSSNLINNVTNTVQGQMASRGLAQAPGIFSQGIAQGLAPYQLQEQQIATDAFFKKLGLPISARPSPFGPFPSTTNTSQLWQSVFQNFMNRGKGGGQPSGLSESGLINTLWPSGLTPSTDSDTGTGGGVD